MTILELDQACDTPLTVYRRGAFFLRFAYSRSKDSFEEGERGQDYLTLRVEPAQLAFAVCDGVGNSFFGGLAAQIVGEGVVDWLWGLSAIPEDSSAARAQLRHSLQAALEHRVPLGQAVTARKDLNRFQNEFQREAYKNQLAHSGTQTNFVAGRIEAPSQQHPQGRLLLVWLGDARLKLYKDGQPSPRSIADTSFVSQDGWASIDGVRGTISVLIGDLTAADCVIAHSDGLLPFEAILEPDLPTSRINQALAELQRTPGGDDVSFLEIHTGVVPTNSEDDVVEWARSPSLYGLPRSPERDHDDASQRSAPDHDRTDFVIDQAWLTALATSLTDLVRRDVSAKAESPHEPTPSVRRTLSFWPLVALVLAMALATSACAVGYLWGVGRASALDPIQPSATATMRQPPPTVVERITITPIPQVVPALPLGPSQTTMLPLVTDSTPMLPAATVTSFATIESTSAGPLDTPGVALP